MHDRGRKEKRKKTFNIQETQDILSWKEEYSKRKKELNINVILTRRES